MLDLSGFNIAALPQITFGKGVFARAPELVAAYGRRVLVVTGGHSFRATSHWQWLTEKFNENNLVTFDMKVMHEPTPQLVDEAVSAFSLNNIEVVLGIGGGSVLDAAKAIAGLLPFGNSVMDHLEGVGRGIPYHGPALPFIAVPTTAGTGSEATKNAVLSEIGANGYKKSFRHDTLVPKVALVDPQLLASCPSEVVAANGMDALTQLIESYVSIWANPFTDALAWSGIKAVEAGLFPAWRGGTSLEAEQGRAGMAYGALLSGITLAQAGLGSVHGLASPLGAYFPIPHGAVCGTLLAAATEVNIEAMTMRDPGNAALDKYARIGRHFARDPYIKAGDARERLVAMLTDWVEDFGIPRLGKLGVTEGDINRIVAGARGNSMQTNPIELTDEEIARVLRQRL
jgi:alcohol dehydrogenase class IV